MFEVGNYKWCVRVYVAEGTKRKNTQTKRATPAGVGGGREQDSQARKRHRKKRRGRRPGERNRLTHFDDRNAGTSSFTRRVVTCATICRCSSVWQTTTNCCQVGATLHSSPLRSSIKTRRNPNTPIRSIVSAKRNTTGDGRSSWNSPRCWMDSP